MCVFLIFFSNLTPCLITKDGCPVLFRGVIHSFFYFKLVFVHLIFSWVSKNKIVVVVVVLLYVVYTYPHVLAKISDRRIKRLNRLKRWFKAVLLKEYKKNPAPINHSLWYVTYGKHYLSFDWPAHIEFPAAMIAGIWQRTNLHVPTSLSRLLVK